eukprot:1032065-Amphidinium_carterae.1
MPALDGHPENTCARLASKVNKNLLDGAFDALNQIHSCKMGNSGPLLLAQRHGTFSVCCATPQVFTYLTIVIFIAARIPFYTVGSQRVASQSVCTSTLP